MGGTKFTFCMVELSRFMVDSLSFRKSRRRCTTRILLNSSNLRISWASGLMEATRPMQRRMNKRAPCRLHVLKKRAKGRAGRWLGRMEWNCALWGPRRRGACWSRPMTENWASLLAELGVFYSRSRGRTGRDRVSLSKGS